MWTLENRPRYDRSKLRYPSDLTDDEWGLIRRWDDDRTLDRIHHVLYVRCRELAGGEASPTTAIIDSQSVKSAEKGGARLTRAAMTRERRSKARSAICW